MRDDISNIAIPGSAKRYARMAGLQFTKGSRKFDMASQVVADLVNGGKLSQFKSKDVAGPVTMASPIAKKISGR